jgi:hypothetical protein
MCVAVRPLADLGECALTLEGADSPGIECSTQVVWYNTSRGFNTLAYRIRPHTVREQDRVALPAGVTREIVVTARVAEDAVPGVHSWDLVVRNGAGDELLRVPIELTVSRAVLSRDTDFLMGYFGLMPPDLLPEARRGPALEQTLSMLREHGMNAVSGGPSWRLAGWENGRPQIDFGRMDSFFALLKEHGFTGGLNGYGGARFRSLHERYVKGGAGERVEQESGLPYQEALMRAWQAVDAHARAAGWPTIFYAMCDETRVREQAERELEFMKMMETVSAAFPQTVRTSGSYSVNFRSRPEDMDDLLYWHQRFFEHLDISSLNGHDETVMSEAARLGKDVHIYNQGRSRYSFGLYQWSEFRKGVKARWQWHLNILHGYQFFDLDGREPDTAMICYGRDSIYPTIHFERCREGAEDFYLYQTASDAVARAQAAGDARPAVARLAELVRQTEESVRLNQRGAPDGYDPDGVKAEIAGALEELL